MKNSQSIEGPPVQKLLNQTLVKPRPQINSPPKRTLKVPPYTQYPLSFRERMMQGLKKEVTTETWFFTTYHEQNKGIWRGYLVQRPCTEGFCQGTSRKVLWAARASRVQWIKMGTCLAVPSPFSSGIILFKEWAKTLEN